MLKSLESLYSIDYDNYEIIIVDNASTDGSSEAIEQYVNKRRPSGISVKIVRSDVNKGYAGGMNLGWKAIDKDSRIVAFLNNDLVVEPSSLRQLVEFLIGNEDVGAASGLLYYPDGSTIYSAGWATDDILSSIGICHGAKYSDCPSAGKPHPVSYADGAYYVAKVDVIRRLGFDGMPFIDETFLYADDLLLSLKLWNSGYGSYYVPVVAGVHYVSLTTRQSGTIKYYPIRAKFIVHSIVKRPFYHLTYIYYLRVKYSSYLLCKLGIEKYCTMYKATVDGWRVGQRLKAKYGIIDLSNVPRVRLPSIVTLSHVFFPVRS
ncbi:MAG: glycosyltransferase, partial [Infirmifilum sp.]